MQQDFTPKKEQITFGLDSVVIRKCLSDIQGGRTLDCTGFAEDIIKAGHFIAVKDGVYSPCPVSGDTFTAIPEGAKFAGVLTHTMLASKPAAGIMTIGVVNSEAIPYKMDAVAEAFAKDCPHIVFECDEEA